MKSRGKKKFNIIMTSYGIYSPWDHAKKELPSIKNFFLTVPAQTGIEFGYILNITKAKGRRLTFKIDHPPFKDDKGNIRPPFTGEVFVKTNDWDFFLGDYVWEPIEDKIGEWRLTSYIDNTIIADKTFTITRPD
ncbi:MAG: DUF3859 domain-containing protein [Fibrobacteria bacterium]|nr:DUF3859 domain-containing protein [Fibrobacteria bacterium]